jgi:pimeloyl-ACP methyl ester carboxylesterase
MRLVNDLLEGATSDIVAGVPVELICKGAGRPLLFLHGMDGLEGSLGLIDRLAAHFRVYAPSHPGFGATDLPKNFSTVDDLAYFYLDLLDALDLTDVCLAGMSFGGWIATEILIKNQSRIARAVLGAPLGLKTSNRRQQDLADIFMLSREDAERLQQSTQSPSLDLTRLSDSGIRRVMRNWEATSLFGWSPYLNDPKLAQRLHRATVPTLLAWGKDDALVPPSYWQAYKAALPNVECVSLEKCGHRVNADQPQRMADLIVEFAADKALQGARS